MDQKKYFVALSTHPRLGARTIGKLHKRFKDLAKVWQAKVGDLAAAGLEAGQITAVQEVVSKVDPDRALADFTKRGIEIITLADANYPSLLKEIPDLPAVLYMKGQILPQDEMALAVVGSRKYSSYGQRITEDLVFELAKHKLTIVSGLALGIDALAHQAALAAKGRTIAVLGCGLDQIYPVSNTRLADKIIQSGGAILTEFPLGTIPFRSNFPIRNRIIAGLSLGTLVVEAAVDSGSLITAHAALDYNREVYAVPGDIYAETSAGPNHLLKIGAKIVTEANDILADLQIDQKSAEKQAQIIIADTPEEEILLKLLKKPQLVDELIRGSKLPSALVNSTLIMLEMKGMITNLGGTSYVIRGKLKGKS